MTSSPLKRPLFDIRLVADYLQEGAIVLTPNLRLARKIRDAWAHKCMQEGLDVWQAPRVFALETWLDQKFQELVDGAFEPALVGVAATKEESRILWEEAIETADEAPSTLNPDGFRDLAASGWQRLKEFKLTTRDLSQFHHRGLDQLRQWAARYETRLRDRDLISSEDRTEIVRRGFAERSLAEEKILVLVGFQTLSPQLEELFGVACQSLHRVAGGKLSAAGTQCYRHAADQLDNEIAAIADWASLRREQNPEARIGIVAPQLSANKNKIERMLLQRLDPALSHPDANYREPPYNISAGVPLAQTPVVSASLQLLNLLRPRQDIPQLCQLLTTPFWGDALGEGNLKCQVQMSVRDLGVHRLSTAQFRQLVHRFESNDSSAASTTAVSQRLQAVANLGRAANHRQSHDDWRRLFEAVLDTLHWPGVRSLDSLEYQQVQHWNRVLSDFACLDRISAPVSLGKALQRLESLAKNQVFHAKTTDSNIQVLGLLEAAGLAFDHLWVMDMDDRHWPQPTSPHPLLPVPLQRELSMPRACPEKELALSRDLFDLFSASADEVIFSYSTWEGDIALQPTQLVAGLDPLDTRGFTHPISQAVGFNPPSALELVEDSSGPALENPATIRGGTRVLTDQGQCPFNAFARWRLGAFPLLEPSSGLGPLFRGNLIHLALDFIWQRLESHAALLRLSPAERQTLIREATDAAVSHTIKREPLLTRADLGERLLELEIERQVTLLDKWLNCEADRSAFTVIDREKRLELNLEEFRLHIRIDRLDRLENGDLIVIDYKTGSASVTSLPQQRVTEPQLPLYALAVNQHMGATPAALTYGIVNARNLGFVGVGERKDILPGCKTMADLKSDLTWDETAPYWQASLAEIAREFTRGDAAVEFYSRNAMDYNFDLLPLNRWQAREAIDAFVSGDNRGRDE